VSLLGSSRIADDDISREWQQASDPQLVRVLILWLNRARIIRKNRCATRSLYRHHVRVIFTYVFYVDIKCGEFDVLKQMHPESTREILS